MSLTRTVSIRFQYKIMAVRHAGLRIVGTLSTRRSGPQPVEAQFFFSQEDDAIVVLLRIHRRRGDEAPGRDLEDGNRLAFDQGHA